MIYHDGMLFANLQNFDFSTLSYHYAFPTKEPSSNFATKTLALGLGKPVQKLKQSFMDMESKMGVFSALFSSGNHFFFAHSGWMLRFGVTLALRILGQR